MKQERKKIMTALLASTAGASGVLCVVLTLLMLVVTNMKSIHGTSVATRPRAVCWVVHGTSSTFFSSKATSDFCVIYYTTKQSPYLWHMHAWFSQGHVVYY